MQLSAAHRTQYITHHCAGVNLWSHQDQSGSGSALEKQHHIHIAWNRSTYAEVRTYSIYYSLAHVVCLCLLFSCYAIAMPCIASSLSFHAMPCHAMPRPAMSALLRRAPSLVSPILPSLRLTFPQCPIQPSRRSAHKQDFTLVSELLQPSVLCPVLPCLVPQK